MAMWPRQIYTLERRRSKAESTSALVGAFEYSSRKTTPLANNLAATGSLGKYVAFVRQCFMCADHQIAVGEQGACNLRQYFALLLDIKIRKGEIATQDQIERTDWDA